MSYDASRLPSKGFHDEGLRKKVKELARRISRIEARAIEDHNQLVTLAEKLGIELDDQSEEGDR